MLFKRRWIIALAIGIGVVGASAVEAQLRMPFKRKQAETKQGDELALTQTAGPWLIMCASFSGEQGMEEARQLATEFRSKNVKAYVYTHRFDHSKKIQGSGWQQPADGLSDPVYKPWHAASGDKVDQIAVLVGDFADLSDPNATKYLKVLREYTPDSMSQSAYVGSNQAIEQRMRAKGLPLASAFLMPNPILPSDFFKATADKETQDTLYKLNKGKKYSLLKCKGPYSVRVATFSGKRKFNVTASEIKQAKRQMEERMRSKDPLTGTESDSGEALYQANVLCRVLRKAGIEAYEYHDLYESFVCVGSFASPTADGSATTAESGKQEMDPAMAAVIQKYKATTQVTPNGPIVKAKTIRALEQFNIYFDAQPMPVKVPKIKRRGFGLLGR